MFLAPEYLRQPLGKQHTQKKQQLYRIFSLSLTRKDRTKTYPPAALVATGSCFCSRHFELYDFMTKRCFVCLFVFIFVIKILVVIFWEIVRFRKKKLLWITFSSFSLSDIRATILSGTHGWELFVRYKRKMAEGSFCYVFLSPKVTTLSLENVFTSLN